MAARAVAGNGPVADDLAHLYAAGAEGARAGRRRRPRRAGAQAVPYTSRDVSTMTGTRASAVPLPSMICAKPSSRASCAVPGPTAKSGKFARGIDRGAGGESAQPVAAGDDQPGDAGEDVAGDRQVLDLQQRLDRHLVAERFELRAEARQRRARAG